jgi:hypothetical protein
MIVCVDIVCSPTLSILRIIDARTRRRLRMALHGRCQDQNQIQGPHSKHGKKRLRLVKGADTGEALVNYCQMFQWPDEIFSERMLGLGIIVGESMLVLPGFISTPLAYNDGHRCGRCQCWRNNANFEHSEIKAQKRNVKRLRGLFISRQGSCVFHHKGTTSQYFWGRQYFEHGSTSEVLGLQNPPLTEFLDRTVPVMDINVIRFSPFQ